MVTARRIALLLAALLYAFFSSPTPDMPGWPEWMILALLAAAIGLPRWPRDALWPAPLALFLAYGALVPTLVGLFAAHAPADMLRDILAFAALAMPMCLAALYPLENARARTQLHMALLGIGMVFALRYLAAADIPLAALAGGDPGLLYLANAPLVAFAAAWLLLHGCFREPSAWRAVLCIALALVPVAAMAAMMQRATLALLALAWIGFFTAALAGNPKRAAAIALCLALVCAALWPVPQTLVAALYDKTMTVGWNARGGELTALLAQADSGMARALSGAGWGSLVKSPAVGDLWVRFSHALLTSLLWKAGWIGLVLGCAALGAMVLAAVRRLRGDAVMLVALLLPLVPALFLYGSYKSFCFGLLLLGLVRCGGCALDKKPATV